VYKREEIAIAELLVARGHENRRLAEGKCRIAPTQGSQGAGKTLRTSPAARPPAVNMAEPGGPSLVRAVTLFWAGVAAVCFKRRKRSKLSGST
jgi:hypothetical protein